MEAIILAGGKAERLGGAEGTGALDVHKGAERLALREFAMQQVVLHIRKTT